MTKHLIIPDPHAHFEYDNQRFEWIGELVADEKPDVVICIGDWADMPALCSYDKGKKGFESRRYKTDIDVSDDAQEKFFWRIKRRKKKQPRTVMLKGNHEFRIDRAISMDPVMLEGVISPNDLKFEEHGWDDVVSYNGSTPGIINIDGIAYAHYFTSGIKGLPIGGIHPSYQLLVKQFMSCTQGHTHTFDHCIRTRADGRFIQGLVVGCAIDYFCDYAGDANNMWRRCVVIKDNVENGNYDLRVVSLHTLAKAYGKIR